MATIGDYVSARTLNGKDRQGVYVEDVNANTIVIETEHNGRQQCDRSSVEEATKNLELFPDVQQFIEQVRQKL